MYESILAKVQKTICLFLAAMLVGVNFPFSVFAEEIAESGASVLESNVENETEIPEEETQSGSDTVSNAEEDENQELEESEETVDIETGSAATGTGSEVVETEEQIEEESEEEIPVSSSSQEEPSELTKEEEERLEKTSVEIVENVSEEKKEELIEKAEEIKEKVEDKLEIKQKIEEYKEQKESTKTKVEVKQKEIQEEIEERIDQLEETQSEVVGEQDLIEEKQEIVEEVLDEFEEPLVELETEIKQQQELSEEINVAMQEELEEIIEQELTDEEQELVVIEPNFLFELQEEINITLPNDTEFENQIALQKVINSAFSFETEIDETNMSVVALIDTGVDYNHEDLQGQFWTSASCVDDLNTAIEGGCPNGGYDFVDNDADPFASDNYAHGTQVAGILAAKTNNNTGISSLSNNQIKLMPLRVAKDGILELESIIRAVYFAVNNGADVINMSFGGPTYSENLKEAIAFAESKGVVVVAAAGNYGSNNDVTPIYPASYDLSNIISVAALDQNDDLAEFSNYGVNSVDIAAPGVNVLSTGLNDSYSTVSGTSFAVPFVVGSYVYYVEVVREFVVGIL